MDGDPELYFTSPGGHCNNYIVRVWENVLAGSGCIPKSRFMMESWSRAAAKLLQSCPTLCDPIDGSPPGSPDPGILQARTLEWVAISFSTHGSEVVQSCPTLSDPMDSSLPGSSVHGIF